MAGSMFPDKNFVGKKVLLVEDNESNQALIGFIFEGMKIDFSLAENGRDALAFLEEEKYDLVLMDIQMPVMDGIAATREIRKNIVFDNLPIVAMTANTSDEDREQCREVGMNDMLTKPFEVSHFFTLMNTYLGEEVDKTPDS